MRKREHLCNSWFIETLDDDTKKYVSQEISEINFQPNMVCQDGEKHNLWFCSHAFILEMRKRRENFNLKFKVFNREGKDGEIEERK